MLQVETLILNFVVFLTPPSLPPPPKKSLLLGLNVGIVWVPMKLQFKTKLIFPLLKKM